MSGVALSAVAAVAGAGLSYVASNKQADAQRSAARMQQEANERSYQQSVQDMRRQNQNQADLTGLLEQNTGSDMGSTMLTGAGGIDPTRLTLGSGATLLGG